MVERDSALWPYAAYRAGLAGTVLANLWRKPPRAATARSSRRQRPARGLLADPSQGGNPGVSEDAYAKAGVSQGDADAAVASLVAALAAAAPAGEPPGPGQRALRQRRAARRRDRDRAEHRRRRHEARARRAAGPLGHGRDRLRGDERQRRRLRRRRAAGDGRLPRRRPGGLRDRRGDRRRTGAGRRAGGHRDRRWRVGPARRADQRPRPGRRLLRHRPARLAGHRRRDRARRRR